MKKQEAARRAWTLLTSLLEAQKRSLGGQAERLGLTQVSAYALYALSELPPGPIGQLAEKLDVDPGWATNIVDKLEERGAVRRRASDTDRRIRLIEITPAGTRLVSQLRDIVTAPGPLAALPERDLQMLLRIAERAAGAEGSRTARRPAAKRRRPPVP
jgi:DNA-binding MarR family transcriptional regulator